MRIAVLAGENARKELSGQGIHEKVQVDWIHELTSPENYAGTDAFIDLQYENAGGRIDLLQKLLPKPVIVNSVIDTVPAGFIRINGWPGFLQRPVIEAAANDHQLKQKAAEVFAFFNKRLEWTPDIPGFVSLRVIAMIINEAFFALQDGVSTKEQIDIAMKLGTNYPHGPFEWSRQIGPDKLYRLLATLAKSNARYEPSPLLKKEAGIP